MRGEKSPLFLFFLYCLFIFSSRFLHNFLIFDACNLVGVVLYCSHRKQENKHTRKRGNKNGWQVDELQG